ncbi:hypothetical protein Q5P01_000758 [Channa striata]|uniref:Uncharacterized protein n=1 Tax=Channa striata TaxID=64152 RepID=A0AA88IXQ2_CHASR|nr:hypothetical protein Q5P01_000758 [Channa striata]
MSPEVYGLSSLQRGLSCRTGTWFGHWEKEPTENLVTGFAPNYKELVSAHGYDQNNLLISKYPSLTKVTELNVNAVSSVAVPKAPIKDEMSFRKLNRLRRSACQLFTSDALVKAIQRLELEVEAKRLLVRRQTSHLWKDIHVVSVLAVHTKRASVAPSQTIYGELISLESKSDTLGLAMFILQSFSGTQTSSQSSKVPHPYKEGSTIDSRDIVDGHREKTLSLLWKILFAFHVEVILDKDQLMEEIGFLKRTLKTKQRLISLRADRGLQPSPVKTRAPYDHSSTKISQLMDCVRAVCAKFDIFYSTSLDA